jgi:hypothetical protein
MGMIDEMKGEIMNDAAEAMLDSPEAKKMLDVANPFIKPALKGLLKELGHDQKRFMLYYDTESQKLVFLTIKTENLTQFEVQGIDMEKDVFLLDPEEIKKGNVKDVVLAIIKKVGIKFM